MSIVFAVSPPLLTEAQLPDVLESRDDDGALGPGVALAGLKGVLAASMCCLIGNGTRTGEANDAAGLVGKFSERKMCGKRTRARLSFWKSGVAGRVSSNVNRAAVLLSSL
jgi:hypothetical protein